MTSVVVKPCFRQFEKGIHRFSMEFLAVHPTVTLSIVDHYNRIAKDNKKRVVGVILGESIDGKTHATSSFAVPFEEDLRDTTLWYLDHNFLESMASMFSKINKKEKIIGWYSTGSQIKASDLEINELFRRYTPHPFYLLVNVRPATDKDDLPFQVYMADDRPSNDQMFRKTFVHINSSVAQFQAEEVAVEHLLRDLEHLSFSKFTISDRLSALKCLKQKLDDIALYLQEVLNGTFPMHTRVFNNIQNIFNFMSDNNNLELIEAFDTELTNSMFSIYAGCVVRTILSLHDLLKNILESQENYRNSQNKVESKKELPLNNEKKN
ncbi:uncharacterized protein LOC128883883 isoform X1 [Hylaeus volcanicus]|uniref:uncharacterized protein LOC128883883 isoform X1 n=1 Tax=Hylaeus volcanicus TaxID=313075 RepID=UPI0023B8833C|nr:uncharacterized protein LOC128883883 isoform X1 [Hylaeus volcanicus]